MFWRESFTSVIACASLQTLIYSSTCVSLVRQCTWTTTWRRCWVSNDIKEEKCTHKAHEGNCAISPHAVKWAHSVWIYLCVCICVCVSVCVRERQTLCSCWMWCKHKIFLLKYLAAHLSPLEMRVWISSRCFVRRKWWLLTEFMKVWIDPLLCGLKIR